MMDTQNVFAKENRARLAIAGMRISVGVMFLMAGWHKVSAGDSWSGRMLGFIGNQQNTPAWYKSFLDGIVVPNAEIFGFLTAYGELALGIALILGALTRPALLLGAFMVLNFHFAKGGTFWTSSNHDSLYILIMLTLYFNHAGNFLGFDNKLADRLPKFLR